MSNAAGRCFRVDHRREYTMDTSSLKQQHRDAATVVDQIEARIGAEKAGDAQQVRQLLSTLIGRLGIHLVVEDKTVYQIVRAHV